ncbi:TonB-dependent receptor plug domain-containing protein, partial [Phenylobacterium sp.]|uniref:TonB-dependent receptor plug domain-containing protein n=1 Tax=Phenylobacterium sp. TaxID=1871053 RepID=UPI0025CCFECA
MLAVCLLGSPATAAESGATIDELIVTASKRSENLQDVPLSVGAYTGNTLQERNVSQLQDLMKLDTSVNFKASITPNFSAIAIRGVGTASFSSGIEQSVSTVLDGVVLADPSAIATLADIDHVEVLRGPQGMLYGKNASSGVVSIFTRNPVLGRFEGEFHGKYGENNEQLAQGIVNVPLGETLAARVVVTHRHLDGWVTDPVLNGKT